MASARAHELTSEKYRSDDVKINENVDFKGLLLSDAVLQGLSKSGFVRPSPIQLQALPLGRCGLDLIVQAKSGTGKTCVFTVVALETLSLQTAQVQVLVLAPTREIAIQIAQVVISIGCCITGLRCYAFIGGIQTSEDMQKLKRCHIAIGTPGRVKQLIAQGFLKTDSIRLFVLDEADKLLDENFQTDINYIYSSLPEHKQMMALSATYPNALAELLTRYMQNPTFVRLSANDPALLGVQQFYDIVPFHPLPHQAFDNKVTVLLHILNSITFNQCLVFSNFQTKAQTLSDLLVSQGWASVYISGSQDQLQRMQAMDTLQRFRCRILISTDLTARGIDVEHVNLIVNMDVPWDTETYLHRIGRAGRFGTAGLAITIASSGKEEELLKKIKNEGALSLVRLPKVLDSGIWKVGDSGKRSSSATSLPKPTLKCELDEGGKMNSAESKPSDNSVAMSGSHSLKVNASTEESPNSIEIHTLNNGIEKNNTPGNPINSDAPFVQQSLYDIPRSDKPHVLKNACTIKTVATDLPDVVSCPDLETEKGFLSDVSKQLEGIQRQLLACTQQYHERVDPIRAETPKDLRRRSSRRNSLTELGKHTSSSGEEDSVRPSVRKQKRKRSKSRKESASRRGSRSRRSSLVINKSAAEDEALSSDSNIDESLSILVGDFGSSEFYEQAVPEDIMKSVIRSPAKEFTSTSILSFSNIVGDISSFVCDDGYCESGECEAEQLAKSFEIGEDINVSSVHKCVGVALDYIVDHGCKVLSADEDTLVDKYLAKEKSLFRGRIRSLLREVKKKAKEQVTLKKLEDTAPNGEMGSANDTKVDMQCTDDASENHTVESGPKYNLESDIKNPSLDQPACQKPSLDISDVTDTLVCVLPSESVKTSQIDSEEKSQTAPIINTATAHMHSYNQARLLLDFVVSDGNSTELAVSSTESESEDDEVASGETSSDSEPVTSKVSKNCLDVGAGGDNSIGYGQSKADVGSRDYWNHHQIGDWKAYWKSYREWNSRAERPTTFEKSNAVKQSSSIPAMMASGSTHQCSHYNSANPSRGYYYNPYYSCSSVTPCQMCQTADRWSQYYESHQTSVAWWNYYWKYQQWQSYVEHWPYQHH